MHPRLPIGLLIAFAIAAAPVHARVSQGEPEVSAASSVAGDLSGSLNLLGKVAPSGRLAAGAAIDALGYEDKAQLMLTVMTALPLDEVAAAVGLDARKLAWRYRSGGLDGVIAPALVASLGAAAGTRAQVAAFSLAWMYVYEQDAVPMQWVSSSGRASVALAFDKVLTREREQAMYAALTRSFGRDAGYTLAGEREIVVSDFFEPGRFERGLERFLSAMAPLNRVVRAERFAMRSEFVSHDWRLDARGDALLEGIASLQAAPGAIEKLRSLRLRYERLVSGWLSARARGPAGSAAALSRP